MSDRGNGMEEKNERAAKPKAVAKKLITPNMQEWLPVSPKMPAVTHVAEDEEEETFFAQESDASDIDLESDAYKAAERIEDADEDEREEFEETDIEELDIEELNIEDDGIEEDDIEEDSIEAPDIEEDSIEESDIKEDSIEAPDIEEGSIEAPAIEDDGIREIDIEEDNIEEIDVEESAIEAPDDIEEGEVEAPAIEEPEQEEPHSRVALSDNKSGLGMGWYVVHTYSGYENKVKANIEKAIENRHLENEILEVRVPLQEVTELKNGVEKATQKKLFPGYVLLHMDADNNDAWYVVRNTRGVTGFVGPGSKPVPLTEEELRALDFGAGVSSAAFSEGDVINVTAGVWKDTVGTVQKIDATRQTVTINVEMFGRETPVEINFSDVKKMWD